MKKIIIFITLMLTGFILVQGKSHARVEELPIGRNYLDLSTFFLRLVIILTNTKVIVSLRSTEDQPIRLS